MTEYRIEKDSMGDVKVPVDAIYAAQTQRAVNNFPVSGLPMPSVFIETLAQIKQAAAEVNVNLGLLDKDVGSAIISAASEIAGGQYSDQFPVDVFQTGSGTSSNMNVNEVIASLASSRLKRAVNPNDDVNMGQSSNDVIPTAIHASAARLLESKLFPALLHLHSILEQKSVTLEGYVKTGRTHLMDAMPVRFSQELDGWAAQINLGIQRLQATKSQLLCLAQGGTAVGTGINAHPKFAESFAVKLSEIMALEFQTSENFFASMGSQDVAVALSGQLKSIAVSLMKIANDLRWMNSGPLAGLAEIELQALQPGSSIMPGKVNPVVPEAVAMVAAQVIGNDSTITVAGQSGNFELNVMLPVVAYNLLQSLDILSNAAVLLADKAIATFEVNEDNIQLALTRNPILVTALNPIIGYSKAAAIAKKAYAAGRPIIDVAEEDTDLSRSELQKFLDPAQLTKGGIQS